MDDKTLNDLKQVVDQALAVKKKMEHLDDVIASCNAEVGFLDIRINYRNQNEASAASILGAGETFTAFRDSLAEAATKEKARLEASYKQLQIIQGAK